MQKHLFRTPPHAAQLDISRHAIRRYKQRVGYKRAPATDVKRAIKRSINDSLVKQWRDDVTGDWLLVTTSFVAYVAGRTVVTIIGANDLRRHGANTTVPESLTPRVMNRLVSLSAQWSKGVEDLDRVYGRTLRASQQMPKLGTLPLVHSDAPVAQAAEGTNT